MVENDTYRKIYDAIYNDIDDDQIRFIIYNTFEFIYIECQPKNLNNPINAKDFSSLMIQYKDNTNTSNSLLLSHKYFFQFHQITLPYEL